MRPAPAALALVAALGLAGPGPAVTAATASADADIPPPGYPPSPSSAPPSRPPPPSRPAPLVVTVTLAPEPLVAGEPATVTIAVRNEGERAVTGVRVSDEVSPGAAVRSASGPAATCTVTGRQATCALGRLGPGGSAVARVRLLMADGPAAGVFRQRVAVSSTGRPVAAERSVSALVADQPAGIPDLLHLPGPTVQLIALITFVLAARARAAARR